MKQYIKIIFLIVAILVLSIVMLQKYKLRQLVWANEKFIVLLTMTIDPQNTLNAKRTNISDRIADYRKSLSRWAELPYKVIVVESSGYGNPFADILTNAKHIIYISEKTPHIPARGKGYGESHIIKYAMKNLITDNDIYIMKITGRYAPKKDLSEIVSMLRNSHPKIVVRHGRSEWFIGKRDFFIAVADNCIEVCGDPTQGMVSFEANLLALSQRQQALEYTQRIPVIATVNGRNEAEVEI